MVRDDIIAQYQKHYEDGTLKRGGRGVFYDLRPRGFGQGMTYLKRSKDPSGWYDPTAVDRYRTPAKAAQMGRYGENEAGPEYVQDILKLMRTALIIPEDWVSDERANDPTHANTYDETAEDVYGWLVEDAREARVKIVRQVGQPQFIEVWVESGDLVPRLARIASEFDVPVFTGKGFDGLKAKRAAADRIAMRAEHGIKTVILMVGDLDVAGGFIRKAYVEDVEAWATNPRPQRPHEPAYAGLHPGWVSFDPIAVTQEQAELYDLFGGDGKAEADGIPVRVMDQILTDAIESRLVPTRREEVMERERAENERLALMLSPLLGAIEDER